MGLWRNILEWWQKREEPAHLRRGRLGEVAARQFLQQSGCTFLVANYRSDHGEIDLIFRDDDCLVFVEVKTRSGEGWTRPAAAVNSDKRRRLSRTALAYLRRLRNPMIRIRFDVVEVILENEQVIEVRHLPNCFPISSPLRYG